MKGEKNPITGSIVIRTGEAELGIVDGLMDAFLQQEQGIRSGAGIPEVTVTLRRVKYMPEMDWPRDENGPKYTIEFAAADITIEQG